LPNQPAAGNADWVPSFNSIALGSACLSRDVLQDMSRNEQEFLRVVEQVCSKPGLYIGRADFFALVTYLEGYIRGLMEAGKLDSYPVGRLLPLLEHQHGFAHASWGWWRHYLHDKLTDERAIREFPDFLKTCDGTAPFRHRAIGSRAPVELPDAKFTTDQQV
jgi:hypothetical protein